jgi:hypothetical protein
MKTNRSCCRRYRFPPEIISHAIWLYHRFSLSFRDVEELLAERDAAGLSSENLIHRRPDTTSGLHPRDTRSSPVIHGIMALRIHLVSLPPPYPRHMILLGG